MPLNLYIGYDTKEKIASDVCEYSVKKNSSINLTVDLLIKKNLEEKKLLYRKDDKLSSTEFTFSRFLVPFLNEYKGWAIFCDCDFLWTGDIKRLLDKKDEKYAVMCVQHDYNPKSEIKMDGRQQLMYPRKNWSSMVLWNCSHPANKKIDINMVNNETGKFLHRFGWLEDKLIGNLDYKWNWLVGWYEETSNNKPEAIHFTEGGPWFENYKNCEYSKIWSQYKEEMEKIDAL
jgi:lipopolysaccharide biosynthesis glycosyltransferase|tara:strand:+ start:261 stop:953 length:693 start_codon:yes stop_codon:yes gene_type:complete